MSNLSTLNLCVPYRQYSTNICNTR